jgi:hypothetical protein
MSIINGISERTLVQTYAPNLRIDQYTISNEWFWPSEELLKWKYPRGLPVRKSSGIKVGGERNSREYFCPDHQNIYFITRQGKLEWAD